MTLIEEQACYLKHLPIDDFMKESKEAHRELTKWVSHVDKKLAMIDTRHTEKVATTTWLSLLAVVISVVAILLPWLVVHR